ncbi:MAG: porin, partial [Flavobacteriia bacterium]|nr:porin [Flavobacteriia bacterium]
MKLRTLFPMLIAGVSLHAQYDSTIVEKIPFEDIDMTWANGNDRRTESIFKDLKYFTPSVMIDVN